MPRTASTFRLNAKNFFLTYPRCGESKEDLVAHLKLVFNGRWSYILVAREVHEDGGLHLHAVISCDRRVDISDTKRLDFGSFHGNYQSARSLHDTTAYVKKDGDFVEEGTPPKIKRSFEELVASTTEQDFWKLAASSFARDFVLNHERLEYFANKRFRESAIPKYEPSFTTFATIPAGVQNWQDQRLLVHCSLTFTLYNVCLHPL